MQFFNAQVEVFLLAVHSTVARRASWKRSETLVDELWAMADNTCQSLGITVTQTHAR